jgi:hypothetical protein
MDPLCSYIIIYTDNINHIKSMKIIIYIPKHRCLYFEQIFHYATASVV